MANYVYTPSLAGVSADVTAVALALAQRQSDSGTNAGIADNGNPALGVVGQGGANDSLGKGTAYLQAIADVMLGSVGYFGQNDQKGASSSNSTSSTTFVNVPNITAWSLSVPLAKTYLVHVDVACYMTALAGGQKVIFGLALDGTQVATQPVNAMTFVFNQVSVHMRLAFRVPVPFPTAGNHTLQMQWKVDNAGSTAVLDNGDCLTMTMTG